jgi:G3E family GTPase
VDLHRLKIWLQHISSRRTHQLLRLKGVLCCVGQRAPVVVQGIYQWLELGPAELSMPSCSRLVIIGKNLDVPELKRGWAVVCR